MTENERIGKAIRARREARGLSLRSFAKIAGIHHNTVLNVEQGKGFNADTIELITKALETTLADLAAIRVQSGPSGPIVDRFMKSWWCEKLAKEHAQPLTPDEESWLRAAPMAAWLDQPAPDDEAIYHLVLARRSRASGISRR